MSRLRELRVHGFKTFADPTRFTFERGITAVIGPNGSGKSNMADAIRWVLGEQSNRSLRMRRAEDVIFAGSQQRRAQGMAEAIVTLDNADRWLPIDFAEVSIGRRVYRSGESEYLLNGARVRLRDITELLGEGRLGATDLVVVGQGTVDSALSLRPEERRQLFEEAAGVKALQVKKNEALARLAGARENLVRVRDLVAELRPQVRRLALQAEHQERHDELAASLVALAEESYRRREAQARELLGEAARRAAAGEAELTAFEAAHATLGDATQEARDAYAAAEAHTTSAAAERDRARDAAIRADAELDSLRTREGELTLAIDTAERAVREAADRLATITARATAAGGSTSAGSTPGEATRAAEEAEGQWRAAAADLRSIEDELVALEDRLAAARREHAAAEAERLAHEAALEAATLRRTRIEEERETAADALRMRQEALPPVERAAEETAAALADARRREQDAREDAERTAQDASVRRASVARLRAEIHALGEADGGRRGQTSGSGAGQTELREHLRSVGWTPIGEVLHVEPGRLAAVEGAIGEALESALAWDGRGAIPEVSGATGAARIVLVDGDGDRSGGERVPDGRAAALRAVRATQTVAEWLGDSAGAPVFRTTVVAPDLASLLAGWRELPPGWSAITPEGDLADRRGILVLRGRGAGSRTGAGAPERSAEVLARLAADEQAQAAGLERADAASADAARLLRDATDARRTAERRAHEAATAIDAARRRHERAARALSELDGELARATDAVTAAGARVAAPPDGGSATPRAGSDEPEVLREQASTLARRREGASRRRDEARAAWDVARDLADRILREQRTGTDELRRVEAEQAAAAAALPAQLEHLTALRRQIAETEERVASLTRTAEAATARRDDAIAAREAARARLADVDRQASGASAQRAQLRTAVERAALDQSRHEETLAALRRERDVTLEGLPESATLLRDPDPSAPRAHRSLSDTDLDADLRRARRALAQIGSVNPFAVAEHAELSARMGDLTSQEQDLEGALESTGGLVRQLETEIAERFGAAFEAIGAAFDDFARILFAGGSASVRMTREDEGAAPAIEIAVRPPGKRLQPLSSLSGGERALAGVALLFAMLTVHPVPFCVLDEVDAALDEANVGRFAEALRRLSSTTDFVVVTHNRATIEMADTIYGVTMTDAAVSRVLSLRLSDVPLEEAG